MSLASPAVLTAVYSAFLLEQAGGSTFSTCYYLYNVGYWTSQLNEAAFTAQFTATTISVLVAAYAYTASTWYYWVAVALCCFTFCFVLFVVGQNMRALYFGEWTDLCNQVCVHLSASCECAVPSPLAYLLVSISVAMRLSTMYGQADTVEVNGAVCS